MFSNEHVRFTFITFKPSRVLFHFPLFSRTKNVISSVSTIRAFEMWVYIFCFGYWFCCFFVKKWMYSMRDILSKQFFLVLFKYKFARVVLRDQKKRQQSRAAFVLMSLSAGVVYGGAFCRKAHAGSRLKTAFFVIRNVPGQWLYDDRNLWLAGVCSIVYMCMHRMPYKRVLLHLSQKRIYYFSLSRAHLMYSSQTVFILNILVICLLLYYLLRKFCQFPSASMGKKS